ncbi:MAG: hypothetical protein JW818_01815 [Pirellulales bacterium]|nr:hypothetical protein [Pirellulales bacterium]
MSDTDEAKRDAGRAARTAQVPRRFPMGTLMLMVTLFAVLFAVMQSFKLPGWLIFVIAGLFLAVGMGQVWLLRGRRPKLASMIAGAVFVPAVAAILYLMFGRRYPSASLNVWDYLLAALLAYISIPVGVVLGYVFGCLAAGVFLFWRVEPDESADDRPEEQTPEPPSWDERLLSPLFKIGRAFHKTRSTATPFRAWRNVTIALFLVVSVPLALFAFAEDAGRGRVQRGELIAFVLIAPVVLGGLYVSLRLAGWKAALAFPLIGSLGALPMAWPMKQILWPWGERWPWGNYIPNLFENNWPFLLAGLAGLVLSILTVVVFGWIRHYYERWRRKHGKEPRNGRLATIVTTGLLVCLVAGFLGLRAFVNSPQQRALAFLKSISAGWEFDTTNWVWNVEISVMDTANIDPKPLAGLGPISLLGLNGARNAELWLDALGEQPQLQTLVLSQVTLGPEGLRSLARYKGLKTLIAIETNLSDRDLQHLSGMKSLWRIILQNSDITDAGLAHLEDLPSLSSLAIEQANITDDGLEHLGKIPSLATLILKRTQVTGSGLHHLGNVSTPTELQLLQGKLSRDLGKELNSLKSLNSLRLCGSELPPGCLKGLDGSSALTDLSLDSAKFDPAELTHLKKLKTLKTLDLSNTEVDDEAMAHVAGIRSLVCLRLDGTRVGNRGIRHLEGHPSLTEISLDETKIDDAAVESLKKIPKLQRISMWETSLSTEVRERFYEFLSRRANLQWGPLPKGPEPDDAEQAAEPE